MNKQIKIFIFAVLFAVCIIVPVQIINNMYWFDIIISFIVGVGLSYIIFNSMNWVKSKRKSGVKKWILNACYLNIK